MTAADHANTVRDLLLTVPGKRTVPQEQAAYAALDALQTQAETAEAENVVLRNNIKAEAVQTIQAKEYGSAQFSRAEAAEAERDRWKDMAELRRRRQLEAEAERDEAHTDRDEYITIAERLQAERDLAVRQRDHARDALRQIADGMSGLVLDARQTTALLAIARAALREDA